MAEHFRFRPGADGGRIVGLLEPEEITLLDRLLSDVETLLDPEEDAGQDPLVAITGYSPSAEEPEDSAVLALLPHGTPDPEDRSEFRRLTEYSLRQEKIEDLRTARGLLASGSVSWSVSEAQTVARALNSLALVLADRLEIRSDDDAAALSEIADPSDDDEYMALLYNFIGWLRGAVSGALIDSL